MKRIVCIGEALVDLLAQTEAADIGSSELFRRAAGGAVSNVAIGIARLGGDVAFVGAIGRDPFGAFLRKTLADECVDVSGVRVVDEPTSLIFVSRGPDGARDFFPVDSPGAEACLGIDDIDEDMFAGAACLHFGGVMLASATGSATCLAAAEIASRDNLVTFDLNARPRIWSDAGEMRRALLEGAAAAHLVKASHEDLEALGIASEDPRRLLTGRTRAAVVTLGARGCVWATGDGAMGTVAAPRAIAVDTTGAGDAFMAALLWRICGHHGGAIGGDQLGEAARWAVMAGALACRQEGAIASLPRAGELERAVAQPT